MADGNTFENPYVFKYAQRGGLVDGSFVYRVGKGSEKLVSCPEGWIETPGSVSSFCNSPEEFDKAITFKTDAVHEIILEATPHFGWKFDHWKLELWQDTEKKSEIEKTDARVTVQIAEAVVDFQQGYHTVWVECVPFYTFVGTGKLMANADGSALLHDDARLVIDN